MGWLERDKWVAAVRETYVATKPHPFTCALAIAVAHTVWSFTDYKGSGTSIQVGTETVGAMLGSNGKTVRRVRSWMFDVGLGHVDSGHVVGRKAVWWHAALPEQPCQTCGLIPPTDPLPGTPAQEPHDYRAPLPKSEPPLPGAHAQKGTTGRAHRHAYRAPVPTTKKTPAAEAPAGNGSRGWPFEMEPRPRPTSKPDPSAISTSTVVCPCGRTVHQVLVDGGWRTCPRYPDCMP